jgi:hypothetical protein
MGNASGTPTNGSPVHREALEAWMRDIGVLHDLEPAADDRRWPEHWLPNLVADTGQQFSMLPRAFAACGCDLHVESMRLHWPDGPSLPEAFVRAVADVQARGDLRRCVERCRDHRRCVVPLTWWWDPALLPDQEGNEHLTLMLLDLDARVQWFFDAGNVDRCGLPLTAWMDGTPLLPGFRPRAVRFERDGWSLQNHLSPLAGDDTAVAGGTCTTVCLLLAVALWRFGLPEPPALLGALADWLEDLARQPARHRAVRRRLFRWQHAVTAADDRRRLFQLFGLADPGGDVTARPCAVFTGPATVCGAPGVSVPSGDRTEPVHLTLCRRHAAALLTPEVLPAAGPP